jgi:hypothetical protein
MDKHILKLPGKMRLSKQYGIIYRENTGGGQEGFG